MLAKPSPAAMKVVAKLIDSTVCKTSLSKNVFISLLIPLPLYAMYTVTFPLSDSSSVIYVITWAVTPDDAPCIFLPTYWSRYKLTGIPKNSESICIP